MEGGKGYGVPGSGTQTRIPEAPLNGPILPPSYPDTLDGQQGFGLALERELPAMVSDGPKE